mmetsp:Transcript_60114/g.190962  ORF Transcript_60114/g.190962 Transcript_60114/m.190962 type:complete len:304 (-) Transcript_60114:936-1847(-)
MDRLVRVGVLVHGQHYEHLLVLVVVKLHDVVTRLHVSEYEVDAVDGDAPAQEVGIFEQLRELLHVHCIERVHGIGGAGVLLREVAVDEPQVVRILGENFLHVGSTQHLPKLLRLGHAGVGYDVVGHELLEAVGHAPGLELVIGQSNNRLHKLLGVKFGVPPEPPTLVVPVHLRKNDVRLGAGEVAVSDLAVLDKVPEGVHAHHAPARVVPIHLLQSREVGAHDVLDVLEVLLFVVTPSKKVQDAAHVDALVHLVGASGGEFHSQVLVPDQLPCHGPGGKVPCRGSELVQEKLALQEVRLSTND